MKMAPADFESDAVLSLFFIVLLFSPQTLVNLSQHLARLISFVLVFSFRSRRVVVYKTEVLVRANYITQCKVLLFSLSYLTD